MSTIARPYAAAAYEYAYSAKELAVWEEMLEVAASIAEDASVKQLLKNPLVLNTDIRDLFCDILSPLLNDERKNFIWLLAENARLSALPDISLLFKKSLASEQQTIAASVTSAVELDDEYRKTLANALNNRFKQQVELNYAIDPALLGGVVVRAGDMVIDGSVRGKLSRLLDSF
jgi:F-type H+-transporting ATPase subunit delta